MEAVAEQITSKQIKSAVVRFLRSPDCSVGKKLRSEPDLAASFNVGRWHLRKAMDDLVNAGVLVRHKGSGTYVKNIPIDNKDDSHSSNLVDRELAAINIFDDNANSTQDKKLVFERSSANTLEIGLWSDLHCANSNDQFMLGNIVKNATEAGVKLTVQSIVSRPSVGYPVDTLRELLRHNDADGYLVVARWVNIFLEAMKGCKKPVLVFDTGNPPLKNMQNNSVSWLYQDKNFTILQSVNKFARLGYKKIALFGLDYQEDESSDMNMENDVYNFAMLQAKLDYRSVFRAMPSVHNSFEVAKKNLESKDRPEAIYVADNYVLTGLNEALKFLGICPGKDIAIITLSRSDEVLSAAHNWSRFEFDLDCFARMLVDIAKHMINGKKLDGNLVLQAAWKAGDTHLLT